MPQAIQERRDSADDRQVLRDKRTNRQQLVELDKRLGKGLGASLERSRLLAKIAQEKASKKANDAPEAAEA